jgi:hypothetical protein
LHKLSAPHPIWLNFTTAGPYSDDTKQNAEDGAAPKATRETAGKIEGAIAKTGQGVEISRKVAAGRHQIVAEA